MKLAAKNRHDPEIPTGSFADVAFLLLVFFMLTTVISITRGVFHKVPEQTTEPETEKKNPAIYLYLAADNVLFMDKKRANVSDIKPYAKQKLLVNEIKPVIIHCGENVKYQSMMKVLDQIKQLEQDLWGEYNRTRPLKEQKRIKLTIPTLAEAELYDTGV
jgi:biopolymer transport protein ExbD